MFLFILGIDILFLCKLHKFGIKNVDFLCLLLGYRVGLLYRPLHLGAFLQKNYKMGRVCGHPFRSSHRRDLDPRYLDYLRLQHRCIQVARNGCSCNGDLLCDRTACQPFDKKDRKIAGASGGNFLLL